MAKKCIYILISTFITLKVAGQQDPQFTQYVFNQFYLNPGAAGIENKTRIQTIFRSQYTGYTATADPGGSILNQVFSANMPLGILKGGAGIYYANNKVSKVLTNQEIQLSYAYHYKLGGSILGVGVSGGIHSKTLNGDAYIPRDPDDPFIPSDKIRQSALDISTGVYLFNPGFQLGLSLKHINQPKFGFSNTGEGDYALNRSLYLTGSTLIGVTYTLDVSPMFVLKSDLKTISPELGVLTTYDSRYWAGVNYRWEDAASFIIGGNFLNNSLRAGYAIDLVVFGTSAKAPMSHEILLTYTLAPPRSGKKSIIRTPRYRF